jgi:hypothetical protein
LITRLGNAAARGRWPTPLPAFFAAVGAEHVRVVREDGLVPRVSAFYGIVIEMYFGDHPPPHFHARYSGDEALIVIETGEVYAGSLPGRALGLVREWLELHQAELLANWQLGQELEPTVPVPPLP